MLSRSSLSVLAVAVMASMAFATSGAGKGHRLVAARSDAGAADTSRSVPLVLDHVTVIDVEQGAPQPDQRVVIVGNHIQSVGSGAKLPLPQGARLIDVRGRYLIPGLWDLHVHPARRAYLAYPLFLANGITGIRDAGSPVPLDTLLLWRREILAGTRVGPPRQLLSGQSIMDHDDPCDRGRRQRANRIQLCVADAADARHVVDSLKAAGADMIKPRAVSRELYFAIAAEARRQHIPFGGHAEQETPVEVADSGGAIIDHVGAAGRGSLYETCWGRSATIDQCRPIADRMRQANTWFVPTLVRLGASGTSYANAIAKRMTERAAAFWDGTLLSGNWLRDSASAALASGAAPASGAPDTARGAMALMQQAGLPILAGTDAGAPVIRTLPPGFTLHAELAMYVAEGLTPLNALQSATLNPARMWHATDSLGTVAAGKLADLVLLDANPLADITNTTTIRAVIADGRYFDRAALDSLLADVRGAYQKAP